MLKVVLLVAGAACCAYLIIRHVLSERAHRRRAQEWGCQPPPGEKRTWWGVLVIKDFIQSVREERATQFLIQWQERNAKTYSTRFFDTVILQTYEPANIQALLATQFEDFNLGYRLQSWSPMFGKGIFTTDGAEWKHQRAMLRPQFAREMLLDLETEEKHHQNMLLHLPIQADGWTDRVDLQPLFSRMTMDSSTELLFGESTDSQIAALKGDGKQLAFNEAYARSLVTVGIRNFLEELHWLYNPRHYKDDVRAVHAFVDSFVQRGLERASTKSPSSKYCFLDELIKETPSPLDLRSNLMNILVAGRDTTSSLLGWTFHLLAHHPPVFHKLRTLILTDFGTYHAPHSLNFTTIKSCTYLQHVLAETLRLYPPVPANERFAAKNTTLPVGGGPDGLSPIYVRQGQSVAYFVGAMHRRTDLWGADANEFNPERWVGRKPKWDYLPFSGGPRICLGQQQALTLAGFTVVRLLQRFDGIRPAGAGDGKGAKHVLTLTDAPRDCWVRLREAVGESR